MTSEMATSGASAVPDGVLVSVADVAISHADVVLGGYLNSEWESLVERCAEGARKDAVLEAPSSAVRAAAEKFRRERHLEASHDLHAWLDERAISMDDWQAYLRRSVLAADGSTRRDVTPELSDGFVTALRVNAYCDGFWSATGSLVVSWAVAATLNPVAPDAEEIARLRSTLEHDPVQSLARFDTTWIDTRIETIVGWSKSHRGLDEAIVSESALSATLEEDWERWSVLTIDSCSVTSESAAMEAIACSNEDSMDIEEIARRAHSRIEHRQVRSGDLSQGLAPLLLSSPLHTAIGPLRLNDTWSVVWVRSRAGASLEDPTVRAQATASLVDVAVNNASRGQVTWRAPR